MKERLSNNTKLKLISLLSAIVLWMYVMAVVDPEETGDVSIAKSGKIYRGVSKERMSNILRSNLKITTNQKSFFRGGIFR